MTDEPPPKIILHDRTLSEYGFTIVLDVKSHWMDLVCYEIARIDDGKMLYLIKDYHHTAEWTEHLHKAQPFLRGSVKWDGCSNLSFSEQDDGSNLHFCGRKMAAKVGKLLDRLYDLAEEHIPHWDRLQNG